jgi:hypothetical protein
MGRGPSVELWLIPEWKICAEKITKYPRLSQSTCPLSAAAQRSTLLWNLHDEMRSDLPFFYRQRSSRRRNRSGILLAFISGAASLPSSEAARQPQPLRRIQTSVMRWCHESLRFPVWLQLPVHLVGWYKVEIGRCRTTQLGRGSFLAKFLQACSPHQFVELQLTTQYFINSVTKSSWTDRQSHGICGANGVHGETDSSITSMSFIRYALFAIGRRRRRVAGWGRRWATLRMARPFTTMRRRHEGVVVYWTRKIFFSLTRGSSNLSLRN